MNRRPLIPASCFVADSADVIGDVTLGENASVWFNVTIRGDVNWIRIGSGTNVQDNAVIHVTRGTAPTLIGDRVTIGHSAIVHGCTIHDDTLIGMGAIILDGAVIESGSIIGAGALVTSGVIVPARSLVLGTPGMVTRKTTEKELATIRQHADNYVHYRSIYLGLENADANPFYNE